MSTMDRRTFMSGTAALVGTALIGRVQLSARQTTAPASPGSQPAGTRMLRATDTVTLGQTGIRPSRLAIGTGTKVSKQRELGERGMVKMLRHGLDAGVHWWDTADLYGIHPYAGLALREIQRDKIVITSKTHAKTADEARADLERFRKELNTDYIDLLLLHCMTEPDWPAKMRGAMDALSEAKQKGLVRAVGCSCHTFEALKAAAEEPWVDVDLARINPFAILMDVKKPEEVPEVVKVLTAMRERGKSVYGMKILGEGQITGEKIDASLRFALNQPYLNGFTIGFRSPAEIDDIVKRIERLDVRA